MASASHATRLVADIGGTNSRLALFDPQSRQLRCLRTYINRDYGHFEDIIAAWLTTLDEPRPDRGCLAIAAPPFDDRVSMINIDWSFSLSELAARFDFDRLSSVNDFEGNAYALPHLTERDLYTLHAGHPPAGAKLATVGPGTGLGGSTLSVVSGVAMAFASEPGHMGLTPATPLELALFQHLQPQYGEVYAELLVSGPGLQRLHQSLAAVRAVAAPALSPEEISTRALAGTCDLCVLTLNTFCGLLGSICGDFVLANGAYGGLFLAGGVLPRMQDFLRHSDFLQRFQHKGQMQRHLADVPVHIITSEIVGLLGAANAPL